ncbi:expressed unknown protein [Seminavis robusta]|uniref:Uncharacterized protein n=1 Tax=Seminavis robusta TaxID=568900 RepID=A0A9N8EWC4_9STRA|nr:expressed unknown protein [Seminavis robusta]|eukprot:Sro2200_g318810.1 n/a (310) ;mRNA; r:2570-3591
MGGSNELHGDGQDSSSRDVANPPDNLDLSAVLDSLIKHTETETTQHQYRDEEESDATKAQVAEEAKKTPAGFSTTDNSTTGTNASQQATNEAKSEEEEDGATTKIRENGSEQAGLKMAEHPTDEQSNAGGAKNPPVATVDCSLHQTDEEFAAKFAARRSMERNFGAGRIQAPLLTDCCFKTDQAINATNYDNNPKNDQTPKNCAAQPDPRGPGTSELNMEQGKCPLKPQPVASIATCGIGLQPQAAQSPHTNNSPPAMVPNQPGNSPTELVSVLPLILSRERPQSLPGAYRGENMQLVQSLDFDLVGAG